MLGPHPPDDHTGAWDVMATLVAHVDRGDGYCGGPHSPPPPLSPCDKRLHFEAVLREQRRRRG